MSDDLTPILIGVGQKTVRDEPLDALTRPMDLMQASAEAAAADAGLTPAALTGVDKLVVVKSFREPMRNSPARLATRIGAEGAQSWLTPDGGNAPQYLVNRFAEEIAEGKARMVLLAGAEAMDNGRRLVKSGVKPDWREPCEGEAELLYPDREMSTQYELDHGVWLASDVYPLFENALRGRYGRSIAEHQLAMGKLFARFTDVAAEQPGAWYPIRRTAEEIAEATPENRYVGWPYTKFMNAMNQINQGAALLLTSVGEAKRLGVPEDRWLYLHGAADATDIWHMSDRVDYCTSAAVKVMGERALAMAGKSIDDIDYFDFYSCFPSAVEIVRDELGLAEDDARPLTVTGGLPYHGGAGNNYSMNAIAIMADKLREECGKFGMVTANGGFLTKHAAGVYSTEPTAPGWRREDPASYQSAIVDRARPDLVEAPEGEGVIETYTVSFGRSGEPRRGIVIGRLGDGSDPMAPRFLANTPDDAGLMTAMTKEDFLGRAGVVARDDKLNVFRPKL